MSEQQEENEQANVHFEHGLPVIDVQNEADRKRAKEDARNEQYQNNQITLTKKLVYATVALVVATIVLGIASGIQLWYMHRQWKLASDGLSKTGDQVWAAKDAAFAASQAANTSRELLGENKRQFDKTLKQMQGQTDAARSASFTARESLTSVQRALIFFDGSSAHVPVVRDSQATELTLTFPWINEGTTPTKRADSHVNWKTFAVRPMLHESGELPADFDFRDQGDVKKRQFVIFPKGAGYATESIPIWVLKAARETLIKFSLSTESIGKVASV